MCNQSNCPVKRRAVLASLGATAGIGASGVASARDRSGVDQGDRGPVYYADVSVHRMGGNSPAAVVPFDLRKVPTAERRALFEAIEGRSAMVGGHPSVGNPAVGHHDGTYYEFDVDWTGYTERTVATLEAERLEYTTMNANEVTALDTLEESVQRPVAEAIGKARYLYNQRKRGKRPLETADAIAAARQRFHVFDSPDEVPRSLEQRSDQFVVEEQEERYRLRFEGRTVPVEMYEVRANEVAGDADAFDEWFIDEHVPVDAEVSTFSSGEQKVLSEAERGGFEDQTPFNDGLVGIFELLEIEPRNTTREGRYVRLGGELKYAEVTQGIGC